jgi:hypothetical protein
MSDDRISGWALIAGSAGMIITMAFHPSGHITPDRMESMIRMLIAVHSLALACVPVLFIGTLGLVRRLRSGHRLALSGLVVYGFALIAVMGAAVMDGLVTPSVLRQIVESAGSPAAMDTWRTISHYNFYVNQAYAQVFVAGSSVAIFLWSIASWKSRELSRGFSIFGCVLSVVSLAAMFSGYLPLDVHHFGAVVLGQTVWFVNAGLVLLHHNDAQQHATA